MKTVADIFITYPFQAIFFSKFIVGTSLGKSISLQLCLSIKFVVSGKKKLTEEFGEALSDEFVIVSDIINNSTHTTHTTLQNLEKSHEQNL